MLVSEKFVAPTHNDYFGEPSNDIIEGKIEYENSEYSDIEHFDQNDEYTDF